jgi:hypothetical protein
LIADTGAGQSRATLKISNVKIDPGITFTQIPDITHPNGIGGWVKTAVRPTFEFDVVLEGATDPWPGFYDDFVSRPATGKQLIMQWSHIAGHCCAIDFPLAYFDAAPTPIDIGGLQGAHIVGHGASPAYSDSAANALLYSPMRIHFF